MMTQTTEFFTGRDKLQELGDGNNKIDNWIDLLGNNIFTVQFIKLNGDLRTITGRLNCHKYTKSGKSKVKVNDETLCVFDFNDSSGQPYRNVNINRVITLSCHSVVFNYSTHHILRNVNEVNYRNNQKVKKIREVAEKGFCQQ